MTEAEKDALRWERRTYPDLERSVDPPLAFRILKHLEHAFHFRVGFNWIGEGDNRSRGRCRYGEFGETRHAEISLYPPHFARTIGHEAAHAMVWLSGRDDHHGKDWIAEVKKVHAELRRILPGLLRTEIEPLFVGGLNRYALVPKRIAKV